DDLHDSAVARIDEHDAIVHHRVAIFADIILAWHVVIRNSCLGQRRSDHDLAAIRIGSNMPLYHIFVESRAACVCDAAHDSTSHSAHGGSYWSTDNGTACCTGYGATRGT